LRAIDLGPAEVAEAIDEIPILCLAATQAHGKTTIRGAGELRNKESDRIAGIADGLRALGARIAVDGDDITIEGPSALVGSTTQTFDDHRLAMTFAVAGLIASGSTLIDRADSAAVSYPSFFTELERLRA
jgi:3-phosphoshikimate 1-carboxyvinyltransferase